MLQVIEGSKVQRNGLRKHVAAEETSMQHHDHHETELSGIALEAPDQHRGWMTEMRPAVFRLHPALLYMVAIASNSSENSLRMGDAGLSIQKSRARGASTPRAAPVLRGTDRLLPSDRVQPQQG